MVWVNLKRGADGSSLYEGDEVRQLSADGKVQLIEVWRVTCSCDRGNSVWQVESVWSCSYEAEQAVISVLRFLAT